MEQLNLEEARSLVATSIEAVRRVDPEEFCKPNSSAYHLVRSDISKLAWGIKTDPDIFRKFISAHKHTIECWLPLAREQVLAAPALETLMRLQTNISGERWADGALVRSFKAGTLLIALERIQADIDELFNHG